MLYLDFGSNYWLSNIYIIHRYKYNITTTLFVLVGTIGALYQCKYFLCRFKIYCLVRLQHACMTVGCTHVYAWVPYQLKNNMKLFLSKDWYTKCENFNICKKSNENNFLHEWIEENNLFFCYCCKRFLRMLIYE